VSSHGSKHPNGQCEAGTPDGCVQSFWIGSSCLDVACHRPAMMSVLGAVHTARREVKFLDPGKMNCSEGVQQGCDCRSRTRVWGSKMIRYRRSPLLSTMPARLGMCASSVECLILCLSPIIEKS